MAISVKSKNHTYDVIIQKDSLNEAGKYFNLDRKVLIVTDSNIPTKYVETLADQCKKAVVFTFPAGEANKSFATYRAILEFLFQNEFSRKDCIVALGGGVSGDMAGFAAATYMRGIDFYNIPTTFLAMVDSSIGGKTAIDLNGVKNIVGAFYPPMGVLIDVNVLKTLPAREIHAGLVEAIKMSLTSDKNLFEFIEKSRDLMEDIEKIIYESLLIKRGVVEVDENEHGIRQILNFGHTIGHAIETNANGELLHGECVGIGMLYILKGELKERVATLLRKYYLPTSYNVQKSQLINIINHDKKANNGVVSLIRVEEIGNFIIDKVKIKDLEALL